MSALNKILVELQNCVSNEYDGDIPLVWSKDFARKLSLNTNHWNDVQRKASHVSDMDFQDEEDAYIGIPYEDNQDDLEAAEITHNPDFDRQRWSPDFEENEEDGSNLKTKKAKDGRTLYSVRGAVWMSSPEAALKADKKLRMGSVNAKHRSKGKDPLSFEQEERQFKTGWGAAYQEYQDQEAMDAGQFFDSPEDLQQAKDEDRRHELKGRHSEENEERTAQFSPRGMRSEYDDDCPDCFGTGAEFPRLKGVCKSCDGSGKVKVAAKEEEQEQEEGGNKQRARDVRDRAVSVRDRAVTARDRAVVSRDRKKNSDETDSENVNVDDQYGLDDPNDQEDFGNAEGELGGQDEWDDPDYQGVIRQIKGAHLVFKRQQEDGTFNELWQYNIGDDFKKELTTRRAILAGTDIPINKVRSPDNNQSYEIWSAGNGQLLKVKGLPN